MKHLMTGMALLTFGAFAADVSVTWTAGETPATAADGKVLLTYDAAGKVASMLATPDADGRIVFTGAPFEISDGGASLTNASPGGVVFRNTVTGTGACRIVSMAPGNAFTYDGRRNFINKQSEGWITVAENMNLADYVPIPTTQIAKDTDGNKIDSSNPGNLMYPECIVRGDGVMTVQYQTAAAQTTDLKDGNAKNYVVKVVCVTFKQDGANVIAAGTYDYAYQVWSRADNILDHGFDVNELKIENGSTGYFTQTHQGVPCSRRGSYLRTTTYTSGYGINTVGFNIAEPRVAVRFEGEVDLTTVETEFGTVEVADAAKINPAFTLSAQKQYPVSSLALKDNDITWTGKIAGASSCATLKFETTKKPAVSTVAERDPYWFATNTWTVVAHGRRLEDLVASTNRAVVKNESGGWSEKVSECASLAADENFSWGYVSGRNVGGTTPNEAAANSEHPANLYNLVFSADKTTASGQFQIQHGSYVKCVFVDFQQNGTNVEARCNTYPYGVKFTSGTFQTDFADLELRYLGIDMADIKAKIKAQTVDYTKHSPYPVWHCYNLNKDNSGYNIRDMHLVFKPTANVFTISTTNLVSGSNYEIKGCAEGKTIVKTTDFLAIPKAGTVTVKSGGELWLGGKNPNHYTGVGGGTTKIVVEAGGVLYPCSACTFGWWTPLTLDGGLLDYGKYSNGSHVFNYVNCLVLKDGAQIVDSYAGSTRRYQRMGFNKGTYSIKTRGTVPSTNSVDLAFLSGEKNAQSEADIYTDVDFIFNANLRKFSGYENCIVHKKGAASLVLNGGNTHPTAFWLDEGTLELGPAASWAGKAPLVMNGGTLKVDGAVEMGVLENVAGGTVRLAAGANVSFADSHATEWTAGKVVNIVCEGDGDKVRFGTTAGGLTAAQRACLRCNGKRIVLDDQGYVVGSGFIFLVR